MSVTMDLDEYSAIKPATSDGDPVDFSSGWTHEFGEQRTWFDDRKFSAYMFVECRQEEELVENAH